MTRNIVEIAAQAMKLPRHLRLELGYDLVLSLDKENLDAAERARVDELRSRFEALIARGPVRLIFWKTRGTLRRIGPGMEPPEGLGADEIAKRIEEIRTGAVETIPGDEVMAEMRARFG